MTAAIIQGEAGSNSAAAARALLGDDVTLVCCASFRAAFSALDDGAAPCAVLPVENTTAGLVQEVWDRLLGLHGGPPLTARAEARVRIAFVAARLAGARPTRILAHPVAAAQCSRFLASANLEVVPCHDTAGAARLVREGGDEGVAALCPPGAAATYGLEVFAGECGDAPRTFTRFLLVATSTTGVTTLGDASASAGAALARATSATDAASMRDAAPRSGAASTTGAPSTSAAAPLRDATPTFGAASTIDATSTIDAPSTYGAAPTGRAASLAGDGSTAGPASMLGAASQRATAEGHDDDRCFVALVLPDRPGALVAALTAFAGAGLNLCALHSRAIPGRPGAYAFVVELEAGAARAAAALDALRSTGAEARVLGSFKATAWPDAPAARGVS